MRHTVEVLVNETPGSMFMAYRAGAVMRCAWRGELDLPDTEHSKDGEGLPLAALERIFWLFNDDRQRERLGYRDRSLSVADVVTLDGAASFSCELIGWVRLQRAITGLPVRGPEHSSVPAHISASSHPGAPSSA